MWSHPRGTSETLETTQATERPKNESMMSNAPGSKTLLRTSRSRSQPGLAASAWLVPTPASLQPDLICSVGSLMRNPRCNAIVMPTGNAHRRSWSLRSRRDDVAITSSPRLDVVEYTRANASPIQFTTKLAAALSNASMTCRAHLAGMMVDRQQAI